MDSFLHSIRSMVKESNIVGDIMYNLNYLITIIFVLKYSLKRLIIFSEWYTFKSSPTCLPLWSLLFHAVFYWTTLESLTSNDLMKKDVKLELEA